MSIQEFDTENEMEDEFENQMETMQERAYLEDAVSIAEENVAQACGEVENAKEELADLIQQLKELEA